MLSFLKQSHVSAALLIFLPSFHQLLVKPRGSLVELNFFGEMGGWFGETDG